MQKRQTNHGFTIVELLIVIVVIAILASVSVVAYGGIQSRAQDTSIEQQAMQLAKKIEIYNAVYGQYPHDWSTDIASILDTIDESKLSSELKASIIEYEGIPLTPDKPLWYQPCSTAREGGTVVYWQKDTPAGKEYSMGECVTMN